MLEDASGRINENIGSFTTDITDSRFTTRLKNLCIQMVKRMRQIDLAQGRVSQIPMFSPNDFLIDRERDYLQKIGKILGHRLVAKVGF